MNSSDELAIMQQGYNDYKNGNHSNPHCGDDEKAAAWLDGYYRASQTYTPGPQNDT